MERKNIAAFTEGSLDDTYPAYLSINRNADGSGITITARERGHGGNKIVELEISHDELHQLAVDVLHYTDPR